MLNSVTDAALPATERLYWTQPQAQTFEATVLAAQGQRVALNRTLFYPEGGGQPCDTGTLRWSGGQSKVSDVQKEDGHNGGGVIWHTLSGEMPTVGQHVSGELDWERRYRHSQRHTAEHLLAQAFSRIQPSFGVRAVSMRGPECTLDLAGQPSEADALAAVQLLRSVQRRDLSLATVMAQPADLSRYPLRRPPQVSGEVRLVLFRTPDDDIWEASACGGTHLPLASQAAPVVVTRLERIKNGLTRVTFMAGEEATERLEQVYGQATILARGFSTSLELLPARVQSLQNDLLNKTVELDRLRRQLAAFQLGSAERQPVAGGTFALLTLNDDQLLRPLLDAALEQRHGVTAVLCASGLCGVASTLPQFPAGSLLRGWLDLAGGRGGGRPELAQGQTAQPERFRAAAQAWASAAH